MNDSSLHFCAPSIKNEPTTGNVYSDSSDDETFIDILPSTQDLVKGLTELETSNEKVAENQYWETDLERKGNGRLKVLEDKSDTSLGEEVRSAASFTSSISANMSQINSSNCKW